MSVIFLISHSVLYSMLCFAVYSIWGFNFSIKTTFRIDVWCEWIKRIWFSLNGYKYIQKLCDTLGRTFAERKIPYFSIPKNEALSHVEYVLVSQAHTIYSNFYQSVIGWIFFPLFCVYNCRSTWITIKI